MKTNFHLKLTKKDPVIFHNLRGYGDHLIMQEISKIDVEISNGLEKNMAFILIKNCFFFTASNLWPLV